MKARPTWYTAVPTMHQAILTRADRNRESSSAGRLRFIRSSSSSLPPQVMEALEKTFDVPVIEAYGMTEAAHQMASNPLPPAARFPGSSASPRVRTSPSWTRTADLLPPGELGEVVIRGRNVTTGYETNPDANAKAFTNGWFRTGDQGVLDADGYLRLTGRLKELINRGGEKISPLEVDTVIMDHPAVAQASPSPCRMTSWARMSPPRWCCAKARACDERELRDFVAAARRLQGAAPDRLPDGNSQGRHRQAAAHRPAEKLGAGRDEDRHFRRRRHWRLSRRQAAPGRRRGHVIARGRIWRRCAKTGLR